MIVVREAGTEDGPSLVRLFAAAPVRAGTDFILDRGPDFFGLLRARGQFRTFIAEEDGRLAGSATALWHDARESGASERVGEIVDVRAAEWARGGRAVIPLLNAVSDAFRAAHVDWAVCLIADRNRAAASLVRGAWGFPIFEALHRWASVHYMAVRAPLAGIRRVRIREAVPSDASILGELSATTTGSWRLAPPELFAWPDPAGRHRAWIAEDYSGRAIAGLVIWDASDFRRVRDSQVRPSGPADADGSDRRGAAGRGSPPSRTWRRALDVGRAVDRSSTRLRDGSRRPGSCGTPRSGSRWNPCRADQRPRR